MLRSKLSDILNDDINVDYISPLIAPNIIINEHSLNDEMKSFVQQSREQIKLILNRQDDRLIVITGPCSIHDPIACMEYAKILSKYKSEFESELFIIMRVYFEKPRTITGWKGLINDPDLNGSYNINKGIGIARKILIDINKM